LTPLFFFSIIKLMNKKIQTIINYFKQSKKARILLFSLSIILLIIIILIIIGARDVSKEYSHLPETEKIAREKAEGNIIQKMSKYLKRGTDKVLVNLRLKKAKEIPISPAPATKDEKILRQQIAGKVVNWLETLKETENNEESYSLGYRCKSKEDCVRDPTDKQLVIPVLWSYFHYYNQTKKPGILTMMKKNISSYAKQSFQPDFWHCKLLYDLNQSPLFSPEEKEAIKSICLNTFLLRFEKISQRANNNDINQFQAEKIITQLKNPKDLTTVSDLLPKDEREFLIYSSYASDLIYRYFWLNTPSNLNLAKTYFDQALLFYQNHKKSPPASLPFLALATIDMYKATRNEEYLKLVTYLNELSLQQRQTNTFNVIGLALLEKEMFQLTHDKKYDGLFNQYLSYLINYGFDSSGYQGYRKNLGAFHNLGTANYIYDTRSNALIISLLLK